MRDNEDNGPLPLTLVFCKTVVSCRAAEHALEESGVSSLCYHGDLNSADWEANLREFRRVGIKGDADSGLSVLVCMDIASLSPIISLFIQCYQLSGNCT
jgi:superfamily II DNA/RNA helicase